MLTVQNIAAAVTTAGLGASAPLETLLRELQTRIPEKAVQDIKLLPLRSLLFYANLEALGSDGVEPGQRKFNLTVNCELLPNAAKDNECSEVLFCFLTDSLGNVTYVSPCFGA